MEQSLIDKDKLVESMVWRDDQGMISSIDDVLDTIENAPTIDPESLRPRAHWVHKQAKLPGGVLPVGECSSCECQARQKTNFCPYCGCFMED